jgi:hypothetical protein
MPKLASVSYRLFEGEEPAIEAARHAEPHDFGGELVLTFQAGLRRFVSWVGEPVQYAVGIQEASHFVPDAALSEFDVSEMGMWAGLVGEELSFAFVAADNQVLKLSSPRGSVFVCSFERGRWWADGLTICKDIVGTIEVIREFRG